MKALSMLCWITIFAIGTSLGWVVKPPLPKEIFFDTLPVSAYENQTVMVATHIPFRDTAEGFEWDDITKINDPILILSSDESWISIISPRSPLYSRLGNLREGRSFMLPSHIISPDLRLRVNFVP